MTAWVIWQHNENTQTHWPIGDDGTGRQITPFASSVEWIGCVGGCVAVCGYRHWHAIASSGINFPLV